MTFPICNNLKAQTVKQSNDDMYLFTVVLHSRTTAQRITLATVHLQNGVRLTLDYLQI